MKITLNSDRVFGQDLLRGHIKSDGPQIHHLDFINAGDDEEQARTNSPTLLTAKQIWLIWPFDNIWLFSVYLLQSAKPEDDGSLILRDDTYAEEDGDGEGEDN